MVTTKSFPFIMPNVGFKSNYVVSFRQTAQESVSSKYFFCKTLVTDNNDKLKPMTSSETPAEINLLSHHSGMSKCK